ncbi:MAG TPA: helix-turn-helix transcriptional regulator [Roseiflexaceae bacterium]|nr:helix-turn-helix transcriptional regulator [Roseiflexaceae bacterium]
MAKAVRSRVKQLRLNLAARLGREVTLKEVYTATGIAVSTLSRIENNQIQGIEFATLVKLADFYGVNDIGELIGFEEERLALHPAGPTRAARDGGLGHTVDGLLEQAIRRFALRPAGHRTL